MLLKISLVTLPLLAMFSQAAVAEENVHFSSCKEAWAHGYSDMRQGEPGYSAKLDKDHDGIACELKNAPEGAFKPRKSTEVKTNSSSTITSGWVQKDGVWYYHDDKGNPVTNTWKGSYYLKSNGKMAQSEWVYDASYQAWYYLKSDGSYARNAWQGNYYLKSDGKMAVNEWVDGGRYYVDGSGLWKSNSNSNSDSNTKVTNKGLYYSLQGKYDEILVVNKHYPLSKDYNPGDNPTAKAAFLKLIAQMQKEGYAVSNTYSGFRSYGTQAQLYQSYVNREGQAAADRYSARPGYSEHQTGLAFDVIGTDGHLVEDASAAQWLLDHAADYGFVVRYLKGKESVTGYMHEEWHLRYIGKEAKEIAASGLTLEEYYGFDGGNYLN